MERGPGPAQVTVIRAAAAGHEARLAIDPPLPDLTCMPDGAYAAGSWRLAIDDESSVVSGTWTARRVPSGVELTLDSTAEWRPGPLPPLMQIVTRIVPTFRAWPRTYRWRASIAFGRPATLTSHWNRTGTARDASYGRLMRVSTR